jgi:hypothetical protein
MMAIIQQATLYKINGEDVMPTNEVTARAQVSATALSSRRRRLVLSGLTIRLLIALIISWFVVLAFFATGAISH